MYFMSKKFDHAHEKTISYRYVDVKLFERTISSVIEIKEFSVIISRMSNDFRKT